MRPFFVSAMVLTCLFMSVSLPMEKSLADDKKCATPRLAEIGWTDVAATTAMASLLMEGLGHTPKVTLLSIPVTFLGLKNNQVDIFMGNWSPSMKQDIDPYLKDGSVESNIINLQGAKYTLAVPKYVFEAGVKSFKDLQKFKDKFEGKIYGIEPGNDGNRIIGNLISKNEFGLGGWKMVESSEQAMLTQVQRSVQQKKWIIFLGWAPHPMNKKVELEYLEGGDDFFGPNQGAATVYTVVRRNFKKDCPNLHALLENLTFTVPMENALMEEILDKKLEPKLAARNWANAHPDDLKKWLKGVKSSDGNDGMEKVKAFLKN